MKQKTTSAFVPRCEGTLRTNRASLTKSSGPRRRTASGRVTLADSATESRPLDFGCHRGVEISCLCHEEERIVDLILTGYSNKEIARQFSFSESTSYRRIVRVLGKLGVSSKLELVLFAMSR